MWSSGTVQDSGSRLWVRAPLVPTCLCPWARYLVSIASLTWAHQGGIGRGKYYNLSADKVCSWPVAPLGEARWLWRFSYDTIIIGSRALYPLAKRRYTNADIIIIIYYKRVALHNVGIAFWISHHSAQTESYYPSFEFFKNASETFIELFHLDWATPHRVGNTTHVLKPHFNKQTQVIYPNQTILFDEGHACIDWSPHTLFSWFNFHQRSCCHFFSLKYNLVTQLKSQCSLLKQKRFIYIFFTTHYIHV